MTLTGNYYIKTVKNNIMLKYKLQKNTMSAMSKTTKDERKDSCCGVLFDPAKMQKFSIPQFQMDFDQYKINTAYLSVSH